MAQEESESSKGRKPRRRKLAQLPAHLEFPWCSHCSNLDGHMVTSSRGRQEEEGPVGPTQAMADSRIPACLSHPLAGRLAPAVSACCLGWRGWLSVVQGEELLF